MATNTATCPSPVMVVVRSVPHIVSTASGMMVPSWVRGPRGTPARVGASSPGGRKQVVRAHEPQDATLGRANARPAQPRPDLAVTLAVKGAGGQDGLDRLDQGRIRHRPNRAWTPGRVGPRGRAMPVDAGPRRAPDPADTGQTIGPTACGRD